MRILFAPAKLPVRGYFLYIIFLTTALFYLTPLVQAAKVINNNVGSFSGFEPAVASISADGQYIVYASNAVDLVDGDTNNLTDIFLHHIPSGLVTRISKGIGESESNGVSIKPSISAGGEYVVFASAADNLVIGDQNNAVDIFLYQRATGVVEKLIEYGGIVDANSDIRQLWPGQIQLSKDGRIIVFDITLGEASGSTSRELSKIFIIDREAQSIEPLQIADHSQSDFRHPVLSEDGRYIAFELTDFNAELNAKSTLTNVFLLDRYQNKAVPVSLNSKGVKGNGLSLRPQISKEGRYVSFYSEASNLAESDVLHPSGASDVNGIYIRDLEKGKTQLLTSVGADWPNVSVDQEFDMSPDGRFIAFSSKARNLISYWPALCEKRGLDKQCFWRGASNVFRYDRLLDHMQLVSIDGEGFPLYKNSSVPAITADGSRLIFTALYEQGGATESQWQLYLADPTAVSALTLLSPDYNLFEAYPTYSWKSTSEAVAYRLLSDDRAITNWLSVEELGCVMNHVCSFTPLIELDYGLKSFYIQSVTALGEFSPLSSPLYVYKRPETPKAEALSIPNGSIATLSWNKVSDAVSYRVLVQDKTTREVIINEVVGGTSAYTLPFQLDSNADYHWKVRVQSPAGAYSDWANISYRPAIGVPSLSSPAGSIDQLTPTFNWNGADSADQYRILIQNIDTGEIINNVLGREHSYRHSALLELGHHYRWKVRAQVPEGNYSKWQYFKVGDSEIFSGEHKVTLRWAAPDKRLDGTPLKAEEISHYIIEYKRGMTEGRQSIQVDPETQKLALNNISDGYYQFIIKVVDQQGLVSDSSNRVTVKVPLVYDSSVMR